METYVSVVEDVQPYIIKRQIAGFDDLVHLGREGGEVEDRSVTGSKDVSMYMHSSGTTGLPKPIPLALV